MREVVVLAARAAEVAPESPDRQPESAGKIVKERLYLRGRDVHCRDSAVSEGEKFTTSRKPRLTVTCLSFRDFAEARTDVTLNRVSRTLVEERFFQVFAFQILAPGLFLRNPNLICASYPEKITSTLPLKVALHLLERHRRFGYSEIEKGELDRANYAEVEIDKKIALFVTAAGSFLTPFTGSSVNIALPVIAKEFAIPAVSQTWVPTSFLLAAAMFLVPFGKAADIYGTKRIYLYGLAVYSLASLLCGISGSANTLIFFRVLQGIGGAMIFGTSVAILTSVFPEQERGKALGVNVATVYLGLSLGPVLGGVLTEHLGWRSIFFVTVPLGVIVIVLILWKLKGEWAQARGEKFDFVGSATYAVALFAIMRGFSLLSELQGALWVICGIAAGIVFVGWETRVKCPLLDINLFRKNAVFAYSNVAALINYCATSAVVYLLSLYLQHIKHYTPGGAGLILVSQPIVMTVLSPLAGRLSDRIEPRIVASLGMALTVVGLSVLVPLNENTSLELILASLVLLGIGFGLFSSPNTNAVMSSVEKKFYGVAAGTIATMRQTGQLLSMGITLLVFAIYLGNAQITPEYYPLFLKSVRAVLIVFVILCSGGVFASLVRGRTRQTRLNASHPVHSP